MSRRIIWFPHAECRWCERGDCGHDGVCGPDCHEGLECAERTDVPEIPSYDEEPADA